MSSVISTSCATFLGCSKLEIFAAIFINLLNFGKFAILAVNKKFAFPYYLLITFLLQARFRISLNFIVLRRLKGFLVVGHNEIILNLFGLIWITNLILEGLVFSNYFKRFEIEFLLGFHSTILKNFLSQKLWPPPSEDDIQGNPSHNDLKYWANDVWRSVETNA